MTYTFGIEIETCGASISAIKSALNNAEIRGCDVKPDGTPGVDAEIVLPPLAPCDFAWDYIKSICRVLDRVGASVNSKCGLHVHIGNAPLNDDTHAVRFCGDSILERHRHGRYITGAYADPMDFVAVQDILYRYTRQQSTINTMLLKSRSISSSIAINKSFLLLMPQPPQLRTKHGANNSRLNRTLYSRPQSSCNTHHSGDLFGFCHSSHKPTNRN